MSDTVSPPTPERPAGSLVTNLLNSLGLQRYAGHAILLILIGGMIWFARMNLLSRLPTNVDLGSLTAIDSVPVATQSAPAEAVAPLSPVTVSQTTDLTRQTDIHTNIPSRPRTQIAIYTVQSGDTLFGIAEKYNLKPETLVWSNPILKDDPHLLRPGQELRIPPINGVLREVQEGDKLETLAKIYQVTVDDIVNWPGNDLDFDDPQLKVGQLLMVPNGVREFVQFVIPQIKRTVKSALPADAGPGACGGGYSGGAIGSGAFIWPTNNHFLSGNNYWAGHLGIDISAGLGDPVYAADSGVTVFAGWSNWGYGDMVVIDHGNGWQTLYAHLRDTGVLSRCGESVVQGQLIGWAGSTGNSSGPHLHFEMNYQGSRPNPWNYLPAP